MLFDLDTDPIHMSCCCQATAVLNQINSVVFFPEYSRLDMVQHGKDMKYELGHKNNH